METGDYIITLIPKSEWTSAKTREELVEKIEEKLVVLAGVKFEFQQPIQMRFNELLSGSKQDIAIKIFGDDLNTLSEKAMDVEEIILGVEGVEDINVEKVTGLAQIQVEYDPGPSGSIRAIDWRGKSNLTCCLCRKSGWRCI